MLRITRTRTTFWLLAVALLAATVASPPVLASPPINQDASGVALKGYDAVAYFSEGRAIKGKKDFQHTWMGARWNFSSAANRDLFAASPEKYAPQYGGYCAYGVSRGYKAPITPDVFKIVDGKLYLNYDASVGKLWQKDIPGYISEADKNWPKVSRE